MERITEYSWYLFNVSSFLVVMRWVIQSIGAAPPLPSGTTDRSTRGVADPDRVEEGQDTYSKDACPEVRIPMTSRRWEERPAGRERMVEAWASRCRLVLVDQETDIQSAARRLMDGQSRGLLVVDSRSGEAVGVLQERDLVRALGEHGAHLGRMRVGELVGMRG
jgi:hypothetical protein